MKRIKSVLSALAAASLLAIGASAHAGYFTSTITSGLNIYEDQSREAYIDVNSDGLFSIGDVLVGFARLDDRTSPPPQDLNNTTYAIFTQEVYDIQGTTVFWQPTTVGGLTLNALTGVGGANDMIAVFSSPGAAGYGTNLITDSPGDVTGIGGVTLADYFAYILNGGTLDMVLGMVDAPFCSGANFGPADCFQASSVFAGGPNSAFTQLEFGFTVANFVAALTVTQDPAGVDILDEGVQAGAFYTAPVALMADLALSNGAVQGSVGAVNQAEWVNASELTTLRQCSPLNDDGSPNLDAPSQACGFVNDLDITFRAQVPEPATLALVGLGLLGVAGLRRRRRV